MLVIAFGHKARQGKNTAAIAIYNLLPFDCNARLYAYGDALKKEVLTAVTEAGGVMELMDKMGCPPWVHPEFGKQRSLYQWWGTDYRRAQDPDYWVKQLHKTLERDKPEIALITDVRFPNEAEYVHLRRGYLVKCVSTSPPDVKVHPHPSELSLDGYTGWDYTIEAASIPDNKRQAQAIYRQIERRIEDLHGAR